MLDRERDGVFVILSGVVVDMRLRGRVAKFLTARLGRNDPLIMCHVLPPTLVQLVGRQVAFIKIAFLYSIMKQGATKDWRKVIKEATGEEFSGKPMLEYFEPLTKYLQEQNKGRAVGW